MLIYVYLRSYQVLHGFLLIFFYLPYMIGHFVSDHLLKSHCLFIGTLSWHEYLPGSGTLISDFLTKFILILVH